MYVFAWNKTINESGQAVVDRLLTVNENQQLTVIGDTVDASPPELALYIGLQSFMWQYSAYKQLDCREKNVQKHYCIAYKWGHNPSDKHIFLCR